jgi:hypothetical protein
LDESERKGGTMPYLLDNRLKKVLPFSKSQQTSKLGNSSKEMRKSNDESSKFQFMIPS